MMMNREQAFRRAQVYSFLAGAFLYPGDNWTMDAELLHRVLSELDFAPDTLAIQPLTLFELQAEHRRVFGATGSLCYETEYGLPHEFRQSQELADINGFYRAFGFALARDIRERPDHLAVELEFMHVLALKEATARRREEVEICIDAQRKFLADHLGQWIGLFAQSLRLNTDGVYLALGGFAASFVSADAARLDVTLAARQLQDVQHTPPGPELSCGDCPIAELVD
jgi:putative dimethyl sulfoxide reductase chaperone